jgi:hypothetical protein
MKFDIDVLTADSYATQPEQKQAPEQNVIKGVSNWTI